MSRRTEQNIAKSYGRNAAAATPAVGMVPPCPIVVPSFAAPKNRGKRKSSRKANPKTETPSGDVCGHFEINERRKKKRGVNSGWTTSATGRDDTTIPDFPSFKPRNTPGRFHPFPEQHIRDTSQAHVASNTYLVE